MPKLGSYLFKPANSDNWWAEFQYPGWARVYTGRKKRRFSLGTSDRKHADILVLDHIREFKLQLVVLRAQRDGAIKQTVSCKYPEGSVGQTPDGGRYVALGKQVHQFDADGKLLKTEPNQEQRFEILTSRMEAKDIERYFYEDTRGATFSDGANLYPDESGLFGMIERVGEAAPTRRKVVHFQAPAADELAMHVERWLTDTHKSKDIRSEVMGVLDIWREITANKPLKECGRADGIKLRDHLFQEQNSSGTVQKKVGLLAAALRYSALEYDYAGRNPFERLVTKKIKERRRDSVAGRAFSEDEMAKVRAALPSWDDPECVLLWVLCATTGMRRGEAFLIDGEERPVGLLRCITIIPTEEDDSIKNEDSQRMIPIPADAISYLPEKITGRLFKGTPKNVGKRLMAKLRALGVTGRGKTLKSTRHRAAQRLQNLRLDGHYCPEKLRYQILGHEIDKVADQVYAKGLPQDMLKPWIDVIGLGPTGQSA